MAIEKQKARKARHAVLAGDKQLSVELSASVTTAIVELGMVAQKVTLQGNGTVAGTFEVTANGTDWVAGGNIAVGTLNSYSSHNCIAVRLTRTGGTGKVVVLAV